VIHHKSGGYLNREKVTFVGFCIVNHTRPAKQKDKLHLLLTARMGLARPMTGAARASQVSGSSDECFIREQTFH